MAQDERLVHLVHSDSDVLLTLYEVLSASGFQVAASSNALDALSYVGRSKPRVVLCRWEMPEMEAPEFIRRAKAISPGTVLIICSRDADRERYQQVIGLGASDLIMEPISTLAVREVFMRSIGLGVPFEHPKGVHSFDLDAPLPPAGMGR